MALTTTSKSASTSVGVSTQKLRASVSVELLQASVSSTRTTTSITYELSHATDIWTDPDSKNRFVRDELPLSDVRFNLVEKNLADTTVMQEVPVWHLTKPATPEIITLVESFARVVTFNRDFTDIFTLDDASLIDKDYYGNKGNVAFILDVIGLDHNKLETDSYTVSDVFTKVTDFIRDFTDGATLSDSDYFDFGKGSNDTVSITELKESTLSKPLTDVTTLQDIPYKGTQLPKVELLSLSDSYIRNILKGINDGFALDDSAQVDKDVDSTKGNIFSFSEVFIRSVSYTRAYSDSYSLNDTRDVHLTKAFVDTFKVYDENPNALNVNLLNSQAMNAQDTSFLNDSGLGKGDALGFNEITAFVNSKGINDTANTSDISITSVSKSASDSYNVTDVPALSPSISKTDSFSFGDSYIRAISKVISDAFTMDDAALVDKNFYGNKGNVVAFTDIAVKAIDFKRSFTDSCIFSDIRAVSLGLVKSDVTTLSDNNSKQHSKGLSSDTFGFTDISAVGATKNLSDNATLSELAGKEPSKSVSNSFGMGDTFNKVTAYKLRPTDAFTLDDAALVDKNYFGNKGNVFGFSDVLSKTVGFNRAFTDAFSFSDDSFRSLNKGVNDSSVLTDLLRFSQTKQFSESLTFSDAFGLQLEKTLSDGFGLDDSALIDKNYFGNKGNIVGISDTVVVNLVQSNALGAKPLNTMSFN